MSARRTVQALVERHGLGPHQAERLRRLAGVGQPPAGLEHRLPAGLGVAAAALTGFGVVMWIAAQWDGLDRAGRFWLLQAAVLAACLGALGRPAARIPLGLFALLAVGALFAYFGQTYQTGVDVWSYFALWALLTLPLALAARSDVLWTPWALLAMTALALWTQTHTGHRWRAEPQDLVVHGLAFGVGLVLVAGLGPPARRLTGAGAWSLRTGLTLLVVMVCAAALGGLFQQRVAPHYLCGLIALLLAAGLFSLRRSFDVYALSAVALGLVGLLVAGLARWVFEDRMEPLGGLLLVGTAAAALLAAAVGGILRLARRHGGASAEQTQPPAAATPVERLLSLGIAAGLLPAGAVDPTPPTRPWPVLLLTALGAWLVALPLIGVVGLLLGDLVSGDLGPYIAGAAVLLLAVTLLRSPTLPLFVEQLAVPLLPVGGGGLAIGLFRDLEPAPAAGLLALLALALATVLPQAWLRGLLGALAAALAVVAGVSLDGAALFGGQDPYRLWRVLHLLLAVWVVALVWLRRGGDAAHAGAGRVLDDLAGGWIALLLPALAAWAGMSFLVGATLGTGAPGAVLQELATDRARGGAALLPAAVSAALAAAAAAVLAGGWAALRSWPLLGVALIGVGAAWLMPALGGVCLVLALALTHGRSLAAAAAALAAVWIVGAFYYQLVWPLAWKAIGLVGAGALLAAIAWSLHRLQQAARGGADAKPAGAAGGWLARGGIALTAGATLLVLQTGLHEKEALIARGRPVFVELVPRDPRSLMQGDYMALAFRLPDGGVPPDTPRLGLGLLAPRPRAAGVIDARGVLRLSRLLAPADPPAAGEVVIELTPKGGDWVLVTDGWFFAEGEADRWAQARYGEFRLDDQGRALLVGMADDRLRPIGR